jgi:hypothetical protein
LSASAGPSSAAHRTPLFRADSPATVAPRRDIPSGPLQPECRATSPAQQQQQQSEGDIADAMRDAERDRRRRDAQRARVDDQDRADERATRLESVDASVTAAVLSESKLRAKCAALGVGAMSADRAAMTRQVPYAFHVAEHPVDWQRLVRTSACCTSGLCFHCTPARTTSYLGSE